MKYRRPNPITSEL